MKKTKIYKKNMIILLSLTVLLTISSLPIITTANPLNSQTKDLAPTSSQIIPKTVRVAIYNEPNITRPGYATLGNMHNNYTALKDLLIGAGYEVSELTASDISNHKLMTADYDVFILADNVPRENITNYVKEFWLGGGGIISFDSAISYICYAGMIPPESEGSEGYSVYWNYSPFSTVQNITTRHPVTKAYQVNDTITEKSIDWAAFDWTALQGTSIASEITKLATKAENSNLATVVAFDPTKKGGRVIQMLGEGDSIGVNMEDIIIDAIDWLCPRPKGRILFDLSHFPYYGIDAWDLSYANYAPRYEILRDNLVNRSYTIDKLYPSPTGNLTTNNLLPYDMLFLCMPELNFTSSEVTAVTQWVNNGGGLIAIGENAGFVDENNIINYLYGSYDLQMVSVTGTSGATYIVDHPTVEGCLEISASAPGTINYSGDAFPIWGFDDTEIYVAGQEYGNGRVLLMSDLAAFRDTTINTFSNLQYAINVANWLISGDAEVLLFVDEPDSPNYYRTPVSNALNELGIDFYLTFDDDYTNLSLNLQDWKLLIIDNPWIPGFSASILTTVNNFVKEGGRLIMSTFRVNYDPTHPLWARLGFAYSQTQPGSSSLYIWDAAHAIFNLPVNYGATRFDPIRDYGDEGDLLTIYPNATALAGYTVSETEDNANIVLGNGGKTLFNGYLIDQFTGDYDDSAYADNFELWINEISFMWAQIIAGPIIDGGIPGYDIYLVSFAVTFSIGVISIITLRKKRKI
ncbi:MAG: hypothetical protein KGD70_09070 [Candidatus Lokiarchaeota archaeon]|nr:hypothetical protein [Candidatus Lokiarchaeota archaeon]